MSIRQALLAASGLTHRGIFAIALAILLPTIKRPAVAASAADERSLHFLVHKDRPTVRN